MNWKEFIKPSLKKIIVAIIILVILGFLPLLPLIMYFDCIRDPCPPPEAVYFQTSLFFDIFITGLAGIGLAGIGIFIGVLIVYVIVSYLISCLIFTLIKKKPK